MQSEWTLTDGEHKRLIDPDWNQVYHALLMLNGGQSHDQVELELVDVGTLVAGGGDDGRYIVIYFPVNHPDVPSLTLTDLSLEGPDVTLTVVSPATYRAKYGVKFPLVEKVFKHFFLTMTVPRDVRWETDNTGEEATFE